MEETKIDKSKRSLTKGAASATGLAALAAVLGSGSKLNAQTIELNAMGPTPEQAQALMQLPDQPVVLVNLLKFSRDGAGAEDFEQYGRDVSRILESLGAEVLFRGRIQTTFIGGAEWDQISLVRYPNPGTPILMSQSEEYRAISGNRTLGLEGQVNLAVFELPIDEQ